MLGRQNLHEDLGNNPYGYVPRLGERRSSSMIWYTTRTEAYLIFVLDDLKKNDNCGDGVEILRDW